MQSTLFSTNLTHTPAWQALAAQHAAMHDFCMLDAFHADPQRFQRYSLEQDGLLLDYSKNLIDDTTLECLLRLADDCQVPQALDALFAGVQLNTSEQRAALHTALRRPATDSLNVDGQDVIPDVHAVQAKMAQLVESVHSGEWRGYTGKVITDVVNIGIGGSFLGPHLVVEALQPFALHKVRCLFLANIDSSEFYDLSQKVQPETTLFVISSKSFGTLETLKNALAARAWFLEQGTPADLARHFIAVSSNINKAVEFGIAAENILPMWDWVGGRYSLWSAIGLPIAFSVGMDNFKALLAGAWSMDQHVQTAPLAQNMPVIMALLGLWYSNFYHSQSYAVLPYDNALRTLPDYLQQLDMESNGKRVRHDGSAIDYDSGSIIWGNLGTNGQHAYHQLLLQGTHLIPADFIVAAQTQHPIADHHQWLYANALSQSQALMQGKSLAEAETELRAQGLSETEVQRLAPHKVIPGNRPSNTLVLTQLDPHNLGALIALYEHKVFVQSVIWGINPFDQWGVELGKVLGEQVYQQLTTEPEATLDASTQGLIRYFQRQAYASSK